MRRTHLIGSALRHYWKTNIGITLGVALSSMVIVGALLVGDSIRGSLEDVADARMGSIEAVMQTHDRFFRSNLAESLSNRSVFSAAVLHTEGSLVVPSSSQRANRIQLYGVDDSFWDLGPSGNRYELPARSIAICTL